MQSAKVPLTTLISEARKRSVKFPHQKGALVTTAQPQTMAHADLTMQGAIDRLQFYFRDNPELKSKSWEMLK